MLDTRDALPNLLLALSAAVAAGCGTVEKATARRTYVDEEALKQVRAIGIERTTLRSVGETYPRKAWYEVQRPSTSPHVLLTEGRVFEWPLLDELDKVRTVPERQERLASASERRQKGAGTKAPSPPKPAAEKKKPSPAPAKPAEAPPAKKAPEPEKEPPTPKAPARAEEQEEAPGAEPAEVRAATKEPETAPAPAAKPKRGRSRSGTAE